MLALGFARSTAPMAFALRFSILPLIDSIMQFAFHRGVEPGDPPLNESRLSGEHEHEIRCSSINLQSFTRSKYFEAEVHLSGQPKTLVRKNPDS